ncbi:MAG: hypothetical protein HKO57_10180, partial [Akkermansiaceae bacterium]|nr:hypothetical protein [Akkermansiaceae bacterium]
FGKPKEGRERLAKMMTEWKPTVLVACYGTGAAMSEDRGWTIEPGAEARSRAGEAESLALFIEAYGNLLDLMEDAADGTVRETILVAPPPLENLGAPWPDQGARNARLAEYRDAIRALAQRRKARFVDLYGAMGGEGLVAGKRTEAPLTENGVHYGDAGYTVIARELAAGLGLELPEGLSANDPAVVAMRAAVVKKNRLFFHRWRPVNETYLFLFRKHEQGQNAGEIPRFDPLIKKEEERIAGLRKAVFESSRKEN